MKLLNRRNQKFSVIISGYVLVNVMCCRSIFSVQPHLFKIAVLLPVQQTTSFTVDAANRSFQFAMVNSGEND
jgi:hypothetical protein